MPRQLQFERPNHYVGLRASISRIEFCFSCRRSSNLLIGTGCIKARHHLAGRKRLIVAEHRIAIRKHLKRKTDMTLAELREALGLECTLPAIHYVLVDMGLT